MAPPSHSAHHSCKANSPVSSFSLGSWVSSFDLKDRANLRQPLLHQTSWFSAVILSGRVERIGWPFFPTWFAFFCDLLSPLLCRRSPFFGAEDYQNSRSYGTSRWSHWSFARCLHGRISACLFWNPFLRHRGLTCSGRGFPDLCWRWLGCWTCGVSLLLTCRHLWLYSLYSFAE